ncbi:nuclear transport factor 2 family protein [Arsenicibacter rosenii]|uniref:SnoaL-like domain-containing protein n=1 Tax=Arsenicibacter rosenii TaxID=1750698 RepID=A0A1S2VFP5_9BACT|nr:nuclear transport factor 2 family protein [Arsenicibacter rosenii]OIN57534.1 hypothetical protein BLX24_18765 [Arsenicibacter rosenii]
MSSIEANKSLVRAFYRRAIGQGDLAFAREIIADTYQHHPRLGAPTWSPKRGQPPRSGKETLLAMIAAMPRMPEPAAPPTPPFMRLIAEGEWVVTNMAFQWGGQQQVVVDLFRIADGQLAEHRDVTVRPPATSLNGRMLMDGPLPVTGDDALTRRNKQRVMDFYTHVVLTGQNDVLDRYVAVDLTQHAPDIADGRAGLADYLRRLPATPVIKTVVAEGDFVVVFATIDDRELVTVYRLAGDRIVEQWQV